jgi:hypothetical protein
LPPPLRARAGEENQDGDEDEDGDLDADPEEAPVDSLFSQFRDYMQHVPPPPPPPPLIRIVSQEERDTDEDGDLEADPEESSVDSLFSRDHTDEEADEGSDFADAPRHLECLRARQQELDQGNGRESDEDGLTAS